MKNLFLFAAVLFVSVGAYASDELAYQYCHTRKEWISSDGAKAALKAEKAGKISASIFKEIWYATCNEEASMEFAALAKKGEFDVDAFKLVMGKTCIGEPRLARSASAEVAKASAKKTLDIKTFIRFWDESCEFKPAFESAKAAKAGKLDEKAFLSYYSVLYGRCITLTHGHGAEAQKMAAGIKDGSIRQEAFLQAWGKTCKFDAALAAGQRKLKSLAAPTDYETEPGEASAD